MTHSCSSTLSGVMRSTVRCCSSRSSTIDAGSGRGEPLSLGKGRVIREGSSVAIMSIGARLAECLKAADKLAAYGLSATVADARFAKPLDTALVRRLAANHEVLVTVEEGSIGGFGAHVLHFAAWDGLLDKGLKIRPLVLPDRFIDQDTPDRMYESRVWIEGVSHRVFRLRARPRAARYWRMRPQVSWSTHIPAVRAYAFVAKCSEVSPMQMKQTRRRVPGEPGAAAAVPSSAAFRGPRVVDGHVRAAPKLRRI